MEGRLTAKGLTPGGKPLKILESAADHVYTKTYWPNFPIEDGVGENLVTWHDIYPERGDP